MGLPDGVPSPLDARLAIPTDPGEDLTLDPTVDMDASTATAMKHKQKRNLMEPPEVA
jgi:hypothetical protein